MEGTDEGLASMSIAELNKERKRLLAELDKNTEKEGKNGSKDSGQKGQV